MNLEEIVSRLDGITSRLETGRNAQEAVTSPATVENVAEAALASKAHQGNQSVASASNSTETYVDPLRKSFETLARSHNGYRVLGSDKVLDDPISYLRRKSRDGVGYAVSDKQLGGMIATLLQANKGKEGVSFDQFYGNMSAAAEMAFGRAAEKGAIPESIAKAVDTTVGGPLIRTDIDPVLREAYLRKFPALEIINSIPANGLKHTYNQRTATGNAVTVSELGDLGTAGADANSTYAQVQSTNVAVLASRRAISLKAQYATRQSGMTSFDLWGPDNLEVGAAITALARKDQALLLQGNQTDNTGTLSNESGLYDVNAYDGLRKQLSGGSTSITKQTTDAYSAVLNRAVAQIANAGGDVDALRILLSYGGRIAVNAEFQQFLRLVDKSPGTGMPTNMSANGFVTVADMISKFLTIPASAQGEGVGNYTFGGNPTEDMYVVDPAGISFAYLGSPSPVVLELPIGYNGQLSNVYIIFMMHGLVIDVLSFHRKIRIALQTV